MLRKMFTVKYLNFQNNTIIKNKFYFAFNISKVNFFHFEGNDKKKKPKMINRRNTENMKIFNENVQQENKHRH